MSGDVLVWFILLLLILFFDGTVIHLHKINKMPLWISGIIMAILVPVLGFSIGAILLKISRVVDPSGSHEGSAFAAAFIALFLLVNALVFFVSGLIIKSVSYLKSKS